MKKLVAVMPILFLVAGLAACQPVSTPPAPPPPPTATPAATFTPLPPTPTLAPTATPILPLNSPSGAPLRSIHMFTVKDGWGLIDNALLVTHDAGITWASVPLPDGEVNAQTAAHFTNLREAVLVVPDPQDQTGRQYRTADAGPTWQVVPLPFGRGQLDRAGFFMAEVSAGPEEMEIAIYQTLDWIVWAKVFPGETGEAGTTLPKEGLKTGISFLTPERGWLGLASQPGKVGLYRTTDSGRHWLPQDIPLPQNMEAFTTSVQPPFFFQGNALDGFLPVDFATAQTGESTRVFYVTRDGGETWNPGEALPNGGAYTFIDPQNGWAWGKRGLYFTNNGGASWLLMPVVFNRAERATQLNFIDPLHGWLITVGQKSRVHLYQTNDGGYSWIMVNP